MIQFAAGWLGRGPLPWDGESTTEFNKPEAGELLGRIHGQHNSPNGQTRCQRLRQGDGGPASLGAGMDGNSGSAPGTPHAQKRRSRRPQERRRTDDDHLPRGHQEAMRETLDECGASKASQTGDSYRWELTAPGEDADKGMYKFVDLGGKWLSGTFSVLNRRVDRGIVAS